MKTRITIALVILTFTTSVLPAHNTDPSDNSSSTEIVSLEKVPIVQVTLNGKTAYFVLDSGSDVSMVHQPEASDYGFTFQKRASKSIVGASGGSQPLFKASGVDLLIDHQSLHTLFYATDLTSVVASLATSTGFSISGIIGMDLMRKYGFEIDYGNETLVLHPVL